MLAVARGIKFVAMVDSMHPASLKRKAEEVVVDVTDQTKRLKNEVGRLSEWRLIAPADDQPRSIQCLEWPGIERCRLPHYRAVAAFDLDGTLIASSGYGNSGTKFRFMSIAPVRFCCNICVGNQRCVF